MQILTTLAHYAACPLWPGSAAPPALDTLRARIDRLPPSQRGAADHALRVLQHFNLFRDGELNLIGTAHGVPRAEHLLDALLTLHAARILPLGQTRFPVHAGPEVIETDFAGFIAFHARDTTAHGLEPAALTPAKILDQLDQGGLLRPTTLPKRCRSALHIAIDRPDGEQWVTALLHRGFDPLRIDHADKITTLQVALKRPLCAPATRRALLDNISLARLLALPARLQQPVCADLMRHQGELFQDWLAHAINQPHCPGKLRATALKAVMRDACERKQPLSPAWVETLLHNENATASTRRFALLANAAIKAGHAAVLEKLCQIGLPMIGAMQPAPHNPLIARARSEFLLDLLIEQSLSTARHDITVRLLSDAMTQLAGGRGVPITPQLLLAACTSPGLPPAVVSRLCEHVRAHGFCWQSPIETGDQPRISLQQHGHALRELLRAEHRHWRRSATMSSGGLMIMTWQCLALAPMIAGGGQSLGYDQATHLRATFVFMLAAVVGAALLYRSNLQFHAMVRNEALVSGLE